MIKAAICFIAGVAVCAMVLIGVRTVIPVQAIADNSTTTDNASMSLANLLPDFEKIYKESLTMPFKKAESKITDPDIAEYYRDLMEATGLNDPDQ